MVIDFHYHVFAREAMPESFWRMMVGFVRAARKEGGEISEEEVKATILPTFWDWDGRRALQCMEESGIALSVLLPSDHGSRLGDARLGIRAYNRHVAAVAKRYPDRFIAFCAVEPHRPEAVELLTSAVERWGAKGLKLIANASFSYSDPCLDPLLDRLSEWGLPVLCHTGQWPGYAGGGFCHPSNLERMLERFPRLTVVAAHASGLWWRDLIALAHRHEHLMCDISGLQPGVVENPARLFSVLRRVLDAFGPHRVLFGSDGPVMDFALPRPAWVQSITMLPREAPAGLFFSEAEINAVLHGNAARLLGIERLTSAPQRL